MAYPETNANWGMGKMIGRMVEMLRQSRKLWEKEKGDERKSFEWKGNNEHVMELLGCKWILSGGQNGYFTSKGRKKHMFFFKKKAVNYIEAFEFWVILAIFRKR